MHYLSSEKSGLGNAPLRSDPFFPSDDRDIVHGVTHRVLILTDCPDLGTDAMLTDKGS